MRQQLLGWKRVKQWMIAAIAAVQHEISTSQPTFLSFAFQRVFWRFWGVDSSAWKKSYCRMLGLSLQIQILFNPLWPWGSQENLRKTVKPRSPELASIEACWTTDDQRKRQLCTLQLASTFACRIQRFFLQSNNVLYSLTSDVLVLVALILAIALKFFLFVCPKSSGNNPMDVMDIMDVLSWLHPSSQQSRMAKRDYHIPVYGSQGCHPSDAQGVPGELPKVSPLVHFYQEVVLNFSTSDWKVKLKQEIW